MRSDYPALLRLLGLRVLPEVIADVVHALLKSDCGRNQPPKRVDETGKSVYSARSLSCRLSKYDGCATGIFTLKNVTVDVPPVPVVTPVPVVRLPLNATPVKLATIDV
jgi:hypothetical protein